jgi:hypothetical protein
MKQNDNFKILILLSQGLGLLGTLIGVFLGSFYWLNGSIIFAGLISMVSVGAMYFLVDQFCKAKIDRPRSGYPNKVLLMFGIYGVFSILVSFMVLHFYNVEFLEKAELITKGTEKITGLNRIYNAFTSKSTTWTEDFHADLENVVKDLQNGRNVDGNTTILISKPYNFEKIDIDNWKGVRGSNLTKKINASKDEYNTTINSITTNRLGDSSYFDENRNIIENWNRLSLINTFNDLDTRIKDDYRYLEKQLAEFTQNEETALEVNIGLLTEPTLISNPKLLAQKHKGVSTLLVLLGFQLLILLPFLLTPGRSFGK